MDSLVNDIFVRLADEASRVARDANATALTSRY